MNNQIVPVPNDKRMFLAILSSKSPPCKKYFDADYQQHNIHTGIINSNIRLRYITNNDTYAYFNDATLGMGIFVISSNVSTKYLHRINHILDNIFSPRTTVSCRSASSHYQNFVVYTAAGQRKHQSSASLASVRGIHRWPVNSPHKGPVTRKMFPFDGVIMYVNQTRWVIG